MDDDLGAFCREPLGDGGSDAPARTGD